MEILEKEGRATSFFFFSPTYFEMTVSFSIRDYALCCSEKVCESQLFGCLWHDHLHGFNCFIGKGLNTKCCNKNFPFSALKISPNCPNQSLLEWYKSFRLNGWCHCFSDTARHNETLGLDFNPPLFLGRCSWEI